MPRVSFPAAPASERKHAVHAQTLTGSVVGVERFVAIEARQFDFGGRRQPQVRAFEMKHVRREFRQLADAGQRRRVDDETAAEFPCSRARACAYPERNSRWRVPAARRAPYRPRSARPRSSSPRSKSRIPAPSPISQCGRGAKSNFGGAPQRRTSTLSAAPCADGHARVRNIGDRQQKLPQPLVERRNRARRPL